MKKPISVWRPISLFVCCLFLCNGLMIAQSGAISSSDQTVDADTRTNTQATMDLLTFRQIKALVDVANESMEKDDKARDADTAPDNDKTTSDNSDEGSFGFAEDDPPTATDADITRLTLRQIQSVIDNANVSDNETRTNDSDEDTDTSKEVDYRKRKASDTDADNSFGFAENNSQAGESAKEMTLRQIAGILDIIHPRDGGATDAASKGDNPDGGSRTAPDGGNVSDDNQRTLSEDDLRIVDAAIGKQQALTADQKVAIIQRILESKTASMSSAKKN